MEQYKKSSSFNYDEPSLFCKLAPTKSLFSTPKQNFKNTKKDFRDVLQKYERIRKNDPAYNW